MQIMMPIEVREDARIPPMCWGDGWKLLAWHTVRKGQRDEETTFWLWRQTENGYLTINQNLCLLPS